MHANIKLPLSVIADNFLNECNDAAAKFAILDVHERFAQREPVLCR